MRYQCLRYQDLTVFAVIEIKLMYQLLDIFWQLFWSLVQNSYFACMSGVC